MKKPKFNLLAIAIFLMAAFSISACKDDEGTPAGSGEATIELTDAPIDNAQVEGVFVTVTDIKIDGRSFQGFSGPVTLNLLAYQNGKTEVVGIGQLSAKSYNNLTLVLDMEKDANGNTPGTYVKTADGVKHRLAASTQKTISVTANEAYSIRENSNTNIVVDFDLRKAIQDAASETGEYSFVTAAKLNNSVRVVAKEKAGSIKGTYENNSGSGSASDKIVVFAYKKGTFNAETETKGEVLFENAANSALVSNSSFSNGNFTLAFLEEGEYDLYFARYSESQSEGRLSFESMLEASSENNASVKGIKVGAGANVAMKISVTGILR